MPRTIDVRRFALVVCCALVAFSSLAGWVRAQVGAASSVEPHAGKVGARLGLVGHRVVVPVELTAIRALAAPPRNEHEALHTEVGTVHVFAPLREPAAEVIEPSDTVAPILMMLHGMCSDPLATCSFWSRAGREQGWLVCPTGNSQCGGRPDWGGSGEEKALHLDRATDAVRTAYGLDAGGPRSDVLIGFSRGAFVARDVAYARPGRWSGLVLLGAALDPDPERLRASGIHRVVLAAGDFDGARRAMQRSAERLRAAGMPARYESLGPIGHQLPRNLETILRDALAWIRAPAG